ncbi:hypothetical protein ACOSQ3_009279 [Xanthoceras sorbifolium]
MEEFIFGPTKCPDKFVQITDSISATVTAKKEDITLQEAQFLLMSFESHLEQFTSHTTLNLPTASANVLHRIHKGELLDNFL